MLARWLGVVGLDAGPNGDMPYLSALSLVRVAMETLAGWNDEPGRTADEVIITLRKFADELDPPATSSRR